MTAYLVKPAPIRDERSTVSNPTGARATRRLRIAFVMQQAVGHTSWYLSLRQAVTALDLVDARWIETALYQRDGAIERCQLLPGLARAGLRGLADVHRQLRGWAPDVLFFNPQNPAMFCQPYLMNIPTMLMTDVTPRQYDTMAGAYSQTVSASRLVGAVKHFGNVLNFRLARKILPWSNWARQSLIDDYGVDPARISVVPPGVDTKWWVPPPQLPDATRLQFLFVGGDFARKGGHVLLEAFVSAGLAARADLHVVTRDPVPALPGVIVHHGLSNNSPELRQLYADAQAFVLPTLADCFSIASIEAMAVGLPVVTCDVGGIADIVTHGETGFLIRPNDADALARCLTLLADQPALRQRLGAAARARAQARFDARQAALQIIEIAHEVATPSGQDRHVATRAVPVVRSRGTHESLH